ncbi:hypothetical protein A2866_03205 [Candidatus Roizmanbacteria bacterium RIFCSPHIGHO2_01_FULL_39_8]|uniref:Phosphatidic acid phosphatase type 2/haloperoxidase domain-containing protein n=2 Tax=Candidatus Roizmaniibacteriota TaxID=1752723 RepID=A0A1F7GIR4_9BACT|nr:MAG: hypothetical protein A2866_03205 [Candidatus Roizmanbacteria bacterium RIFCSPHIGHO2_01_FULL_39_8]OGK27881.1 MAG: hypothetical protein A3C28_05485 [Candidatus Roizmanbacteria bacterium RIFCSPHIGHO2_02_FULL_39_9]
MQYLSHADQVITKFFYQLLPHTGLLNSFFSFLSLYGNSFFIWVLIATAAIIFEEKRHPGIQKRDIKFALTFVISFFTTSGLVLVLKELFQRPRPFVLHIVKAVNCNFDYAMPSGHAAAAFAAATVLAYFDKKRRWLYYFVAILISFSRIYLGCHYVSDVIIGSSIGYLISSITLFLSTKIHK